MVVVNLVNRPYFFDGAVMGFVIDGTVGLAIGKAIITRMDVAVNFFGLFFW